MKKAIVSYTVTTTLYYNDDSDTGFQDYYGFETKENKAEIASCEVCSHEEMVKMLPWGTDFDVAIDADGEIVQHPYRNKPLTRLEYENIPVSSLRKFIRLQHEDQGLDLNTLFQKFPKEATPDNYHKYIE